MVRDLSSLSGLAGLSDLWVLPAGTGRVGRGAFGLWGALVGAVAFAGVASPLTATPISALIMVAKAWIVDSFELSVYGCPPWIFRRRAGPRSS